MSGPQDTSDHHPFRCQDTSDPADFGHPAPAETSATRCAVTIQNPIEELRLAAFGVFPDLDCRVAFAAFPDKGPYGETFFPHDGGRPTVQVAVGIPMEAVIEIIAHELAHVAAGVDAAHGPAWEEAFAKIHEAYSARMLATAPSHDDGGEA